jgi:hypothetical protein
MAWQVLRLDVALVLANLKAVALLVHVCGCRHATRQILTCV